VGGGVCRGRVTWFVGVGDASGWVVARWAVGFGLAGEADGRWVGRGVEGAAVAPADVFPGPGLDVPVAALEPVPVASDGSVTTEMVSWPASLMARCARRCR
jgi:hypothetical protein